MSQGFGGRNVVVTGGTGALGSAVVERLLESGATVSVPWINESEAQRLGSRSGLHLIKADLANEQQVVEFFGSIPTVWASLHVAGGFAMHPVTETSAADFEAMLRLNALSCFLCCREAIRSMRRTGNGGRIVNVAARPALVPTGSMIAYATAKSAVGAMTTHLAEEVKGEGILVNAVAPGVMDTPANRAAMPGADRSDWADVADVAKAMVWLASPENALATGSVVALF